MNVDRTPLLVLLALAVIAATQAASSYPELPEALAVHFDAHGNANGWSGKDAFLITHGSIVVVMLLSALAVAFLGDRIPASILSIPNCEYWMTPERRRATLRYTWTRVLWIEAASLAFMIAIAEMIFRVNRSQGPPVLSPKFLYVLALFMVAIIWQSISMMLRFRLPKDAVLDQPGPGSSDPPGL